MGRVEGSGEAEVSVHRRSRGRGVMPSRVPSLQRQTSAWRSPAETEAPAGTSRGPLSASAPRASLESTARQVGAALGGSPRARPQPHPLGPRHPGRTSCQRTETLGRSESRGMGAVPVALPDRTAGGGAPGGRRRGGPGARQGGGARRQPLPPTGLPAAPPHAPARPPSCLPFPSSRCPLLPPPDTPLPPWPTLWVFSRGGRLRLQALPARRPVRERWRGLPVCLPRGLLRLPLRDRWGPPPFPPPGSFPPPAPASCTYPPRRSHVPPSSMSRHRPCCPCTGQAQGRPGGLELTVPHIGILSLISLSRGSSGKIGRASCRERVSSPV